jgi:hypothetical protein
MSKALIDRLRERIRSEPTVDMVVCPPDRPRPPLGQQALSDAEARLGFPLPPLIWDLYTQVADGGFGPGYGVIELAGSPYSLVEIHGRRDEERAGSPGGERWPERVVEFVNWGCLYFSAIDCSRPRCPVFFFNPELAIGEVTPTACLFPEVDSLEEWLSAWLDGENLWERGKRLGLHQ